MDKNLGIIGGMGPLATVKLYEKIVLKTKASRDQDHLRILIDSNSKIPDRTAYILDKEKDDPRRELIASAKKLEEIGADYLIMPCNTAPYFYEDIKKEVAIDFLHMIDESGKYIVENYKDIKKVGLLATEGTIKAAIYEDIYRKYSIEVILPSTLEQKYITSLIYNIKEGKEEKNLQEVYEVMDNLRGRGAQLMIAGCTEVSLAIDLYKLEGLFIDPMDILADKAIEYSGLKLK